MRRQAIERLLPAVYQRVATDTSVLAALLAVMEGLHEPSEKLLASVDSLFDPYRSPDRLVKFLSRWTASGHVAADLPLPMGRRRNVLAESSSLAQWRGTAAGLRAYLHTATGVAGIEIDEPANRPFHFVVRVPEAGQHQIDLIRRIADLEKPAATTCEVVVDRGADDAPN